MWISRKEYNRLCNRNAELIIENYSLKLGKTPSPIVPPVYDILEQHLDRTSALMTYLGVEYFEEGRKIGCRKKVKK